MAVGGLNKNALASLLAAGGHNNYLSKTPLYGAGQAILQMPDDRYETNAQAFGIPFLRGLIGQGLAGYGASQAKDRAYEAYSKNPLLADTYAANPERPADWDADVGQIELQLALSEQEAARKAEEQATAQLLKEEAAKEKEKARIAQALAAQGLRPKYDELGNQIGVEVDEEMLAAKNTVLASQEAVKQGAKNAGKGGKSDDAPLPNAILTKESAMLGLAEQTKNFANRLKKVKPSWTEFHGGRYLSFLDKHGLAQESQIIGERFLRETSGAAITAMDAEIAQRMRDGDSTLTPDEVAKHALRFSNILKQISKGKIGKFKALRRGDESVFDEAGFDEDEALTTSVRTARDPAPAVAPPPMLAPTPGGIPTPRGAVPTGRIDPKTGRPTYMINGVEGVL